MPEDIPDVKVEISEEEVIEAANAAEIVQLEGTEITETDEGGGTVTMHYWQATVGEPVNSTIQVTGNDEAHAHENLATAAWEMMQTRKEAEAAAEIPVTVE